jgi:hypothetical protein
MAITKETAIKMITYLKTEKPERWRALTEVNINLEVSEEEWPDYLVTLEGQAPFAFKYLIEAVSKEEK